MRVLMVLSLFIAGCAGLGDPVLREAREHVAAGRGEQALALLDSKPDYRHEYFRTRDILVAQWLSQADMLRQNDRPENAAELYRRVQKHDAANARARAGLEQIEVDARHRLVIAAAERLAKDEKYFEAQDVLRPVLVENPQNREARRLQRLVDEKTAKPAIATPRLKTLSSQPISLEVRDVPLRGVFDVISRSSGVSFVFDKDVRTDQRTTIVLRNASVEELIRLVLQTNQLEQKLVNETTVLVYPNTPQKQREYQELVVKSFYLVNADVRQTANMIRTMVRTRDLFVDEKLNLLVIKDTPSAVRLAERLIAAQDLAEPEVMLQVEVMEVGTSRLLELGIRWPTELGVGLVGAGGTPGQLTGTEARNINGDLVRLTFTDPLILLSLMQQDGSTNVLANPRIRVKNKEKARIHIGDRVPVITTTAAATGGFVSESVNYLDVGLKLEVEPLIYLDDEVSIKVALEVSNIAREVRTVGSSTLTYQIGTRNASTVLRLRDGETQVLAGLISDEDRRSASRVPGIGEMPVLGRLFSSTRDNTVKTEIVLLITPRLVRTLVRPDVRSVEFAAGTELSTGAPVSPAPLFVPQQVPQQPPQPQQQPAPEPQRQPQGADQVPFGGVRPAQ
ncbi:MAG TPA: secretin N-terminal domain-containing protein [Burkholderiales bacterium]